MLKFVFRIAPVEEKNGIRINPIIEFQASVALLAIQPPGQDVLFPGGVDILITKILDVSGKAQGREACGLDEDTAAVVMGFLFCPHIELARRSPSGPAESGASAEDQPLKKADPQFRHEAVIEGPLLLLRSVESIFGDGGQGKDDSVPVVDIGFRRQREGCGVIRHRVPVFGHLIDVTVIADVPDLDIGRKPKRPELPPGHPVDLIQKRAEVLVVLSPRDSHAD
jgi:hypothetical protein